MADHGTISWSELNTHDPEKAKAFYASTLDWSYEPMPMPQGTYWIIKSGQRTVGGIFPMSGPDFAGMPDHWFTYIEVDDVDGRLARLAAAGGSVIRPPWDIPNVGRVAIVRDAVGAGMAWIKSTG